MLLEFIFFFCKGFLPQFGLRLFYALVIAVLSIGVIPHSVNADSIWSVQLASLDPQHQFQKTNGLKLQSWTDEQIQFTDSNGKLIKFSVPDVLSLSSDSTEPSASNTKDSWQLVLINGDVLYGSPIQTSNSLIDFNTPDLGDISVPLNSVAGIKRLTAASVTPTPADHDTLYFSNGDTMTGSFDSINDQSVHWESALGAIDIPLARIDRIILGLTAPFKPAQELYERISFADGSQFTTPSLTYQNNQFRLSDPSGKTVVCSSTHLQALEIINGHAVWLTDLEPSAYRLTTYFGTQWPFKPNQNVLGGLLTVNGVVFDHGIGVHTGAAITYQLTGKFHWLIFTPAMDDSAAALGRSRVTVTGDNGKELYRSPMLELGESNTPVFIDVTNVDSITLTAHGTDRFDVLGRVDWINAALLH